MCTQGSYRTSVVVHGACGRVGARVCALALTDPCVALVGAVDRDGAEGIGRVAGGADHAGPIVQRADELGVFADVVIDFTVPEAVERAVALARRARAALLVGTTGHDAAQRGVLEAAAREMAVLVAPNTSVGVAVVAEAVSRVAKNLGAGYEVSIVEAHHSAKRDAPSGTALRLAEAVRDGGATVRAEQILSVRGGDVVGEHTVRFAGPGEYVEITHRATSRDLFARGALRCAHWLAGRPPGLYTMRDVVTFADDRGNNPT